MRTYSTDDLIKMTSLGYFGNTETNLLARSAFINLKKLELENAELRKKLNDQGIEIFQVKVTAE